MDSTLKSVFEYRSCPPCGAVWSGLPAGRRGRSGAERPGRADGERKGLVKLELCCEGFCLDTNLTTEKERGNFFFNEWSLPPAKTTRSPPLEFLKRQSEHFAVKCTDL